MPAGPRQIEQAEVTKASIVAAARVLFVEQGYFQVGLEAVAAAADVTRGALYHHFDDKKDIFRSVFVAISEEILERHTAAIVTASAPDSDPWDDLRAGLSLFLTTASEDIEVQRIVLIDGPAVLGWDEWGALEARFSLDPMEASISEATAAGIIGDVPASALALALLGALNAGALSIANADDAESARAEATAALDALILGLRTTT